MARLLIIAGAALAAVAAAAGVALTSERAEAAPPPPRAHHFVSLDEIEVPIIGSNRIEGALRVRLVLDADAAATAEAIAARAPEVRAASLASAIEFSRLYASGFAAVDVERLGGTLTTALKRTEPRIARVLIVEVAAVSG